MRMNESRDMMVGGVMVLVLGLVFALSYGGKKMSSDAQVGTYRVQAVFNRIDGLYEGDEVRLGGIKIGTVGQQVLDQNFRAIVTLNINESVQIPVDSAAAVHTDGLFGSKFVVLEPGIEEQALQDGGEIEYTQGAVIVSELLELIIEEGKARQAESARRIEQQGE